MEDKEDAPSPSTAAGENSDTNNEAAKTGSTDADAKSEAENNDNASDDGQAPGSPENSPPRPNPGGQAAPPSIVDGPNPSRPMYYRHPHSVYGYVPPPPPPPPPQQSRPAADNTPKPWNAVCVLGLRVYSQDLDVSIKLVKPKDVEEGAILDVDGDTPAGATM